MDALMGLPTTPGSYRSLVSVKEIYSDGSYANHGDHITDSFPTPFKGRNDQAGTWRHPSLKISDLSKET